MFQHLILLHVPVDVRKEIAVSLFFKVQLHARVEVLHGARPLSVIKNASL